MKQGTILVVDDNRNILATVKMLLEDYFETIVAIASPDNIPARLREDRPDVVLLDMNFRSGMNSGNEGLYWLRQVKKLRPQAQVVLFTAYADIQLAVTGLKEGAADFVVKPFDNAKLVAALTDAYRKTAGTKAAVKAGGSGMFWGQSPCMQELKAMVEKVAATDANILITGENGTGKEVLTNEIHRLSLRRDRRLVTIDMGAVAETLFESELFGYVKGAFTDAKADKEGMFELAEGGTLFLDEIGNLGYSLQAKLLTALQRRSIVRVGGSRQYPSTCGWSAPQTATCAGWWPRESFVKTCCTVSTPYTCTCRRCASGVRTFRRWPVCFSTATLRCTTSRAWTSRRRPNARLPVCRGTETYVSCNTR